jgi:hypothetical protein
MTEQSVELARFPAWRQAVQDFLTEFRYGDVISHAWLAEHFGMPSIKESRRLTAAEFQERQFEWLANIEAFKGELLREHQVCLQSVRGEGYRWVPPQEQTGYATREFVKDVRRIFRGTGQKLRNLRVSELTDDQRKENADAAAKLTALRGMTRKALE